MVGNPRRASIFDKDPRAAARQAAMVNQNDLMVDLLRQLLFQQAETNRLLALLYRQRFGEWPPPPATPAR